MKVRDKEEFIRIGVNRGFEFDDLMDFNFQNLNSIKQNLAELKTELISEERK